MKKLLTVLLCVMVLSFGLTGCFDKVVDLVESTAKKSGDTEVKAFYDKMVETTTDADYWGDISAFADNTVTFVSETTVKVTDYVKNCYACQFVGEIKFFILVTEYGCVYVVSPAKYEYIKWIGTSVLEGNTSLEDILKDIKADIIPKIAASAIDVVYDRFADEIAEYGDEWDNISSIEENADGELIITIDNGEGGTQEINVSQYIPEDYEVNVTWNEEDNSATVEFEGVTYKLTKDGAIEVTDTSASDSAE